MKTLLKYVLIPLALVLAAAGLRFWAAPEVSKLQVDYNRQLNFSVVDEFRGSLNEPWVKEVFTSQRMDQGLSAKQDVIIMQSALNWYNAKGDLIFLSSGIYGVDRFTRANVPGYGDAVRSGQFLFPPGMTHTETSLWDPMFGGPRELTFSHSEVMDGVPVDVYLFSVSGLDETAGYDYMADVPEHYQAHTNGSGTLWIEPQSGIVVDYEEHGVSYFADRVTGANLGDFHIWSDVYTPETRASEMQNASNLRLLFRLFSTWLPGGLLIGALLWLAFARFVRSAASTGSQVA